MMEIKSCDLCGSVQEASQQSGNFIDYGWSFNWLSLGHYGGFTDCIPHQSPDGEKESTASYMVHMCHDCCVKMLDTFPALAQLSRAYGGHPNKNEHDSNNGIATPPCCKYAWTWVKLPDKDKYGHHIYITYIATADLGWTKASWEQS